MDLRAWDSS